MPKKQFEEQLEVLERLREAGASPAATEALRKALGNRSNYFVAKAARIVAELLLTSLIPDLLTALDRFFVDPGKSDPQCWAKNSIVQALADLGHGESVTYLRGLRHVQPEPGWGGATDSAAPLRARCALALVQCRDLGDVQLLSHLIEVLTDEDKTVRVEAARAIGRIDRAEAALLLRLRALVGDKEPEVLGACFSALLSIEGAPGIAFVARFLDHTYKDRGEEAAGEAALSLGLTHNPEALRILRDRWERNHDPVLLTAIALTNLPEALDFLIDQVAADSISALEALASARLTPEIRTRIQAAVESTGNPRLRAAFEKQCG